MNLSAFKASVRLAATIIWIVAAGGCTRNEPPKLDPEYVRQEMEKAHGQAAQERKDDLVKQGRMVYQTNCTACHNSNPRQAGSLGPDIWGSSKDLLEMRVMSSSYPPGYKPKRTTHAMAPLPHLRTQLDALHAFLNAQ
jgi:mono/diheme cytochrome c family protein